jgi:uncharacterized RDD family membrane protein YckC
VTPAARPTAPGPVEPRAKRGAAERYLGRAERGTACEVVTPEGIPLTFTIAAAGDRAGAFLLDLFLLSVVVLVAVLLGAWAFDVDVRFSWYVLWFLARNLYFSWFELRWQGATPGKRRVGLRVVDASGGALGAEAVVVRNLTRELEVFLPLAVLERPDLLWGGSPGWARLGAAAWLVAFALMPLFNRLRLRIGDMVAGTMVVLAPKAVLLGDLGRHAAAEAGPVEGQHLAFTDEQLDVYGIYELQVLEEVLRKGHDPESDRRAMKAVCERIQKKIRWQHPGGVLRPEPFLREFYAALRARLESRMLLGKRKEDKYS